MRQMLLATLLALSVLAVGCERMAGDSERERRVAAEQEAIEAYSEKVPQVDALQERFVEAWRKANEIKGLDAFKEAVESRVVPALEAYVAALKVMPTGSEELERIHGVVLEAYESATAAFRKFVDGLDDENVEARYKALLEAMDQVAAAEEAYREQLEAYYAQNRVELITGEAEGEAEAAPEAEAASEAE
ncbi:MAG: hypothetical protein ACQEXJ_13145 [Myxococcota bacterium]